VKGSQIVHYKKKLDGIVSLLLDLSVSKIGFESASLTFSLHQSLQGKLTQEAELHPLEESKNLRAIKERAEMTLTRAAIDLFQKLSSYRRDAWGWSGREGSRSGDGILYEENWGASPWL
jgi:hypothetical protein